MIVRLIAVIALFAQTLSAAGTIVGKVTDPAGGVMPGVEVTATLDLIGGQTYRDDEPPAGGQR